MVLFKFSALPRPFKTLFVLCNAFIVVFVQTPAWIVIYAPPFMRLKRGWSLKRTIMVKYWQRATFLSRTLGKISVSPDHRALVPQQKGAWIDPVPKELIVGRIKDMAATAGVELIHLPGYWMDREGSEVPIGAPPRPGEKVVLHLHGGAYAFLSANLQDLTAYLGRGLMERCVSVGRVFSIEFRLITTPDNEPANPFPTQLIDALTGYYYLVRTVGFSPADIILDGDSAGANLALALTLYLVENQNREDVMFPSPPGKLLLLSPWCDLSPIRATPGSSWVDFAHVDYIDAGDTQEKAEIFCGPFGLVEAEINPYISPASTHPSLSVSFKGFPRTFILCGGSEMLRDQIRVLKDRMIRDMDEENVTYYEPADAVHDFLSMTWLEPERTNSWNEIAGWLTQ
ncbi:alpha/beta-hydrolase [Neolentinus lepideus HHB14362 ss-1]|uniref:Alpha/beta-hydrolase n=1 Tax=Neolentinus lepideus HHB14362 ss-1 TaxID=1314782 RepID=A0A165RTE7_9AGAM|nr:alpha/beta-hydrolase [Neolentinus lepideus HHB14362 ss-1]